MTTQATGVLVDALRRLAATVEACRFALPVPAQGDRAAGRDDTAAAITDHLLPRLQDLDAPALVVLVGSTGAGKSTLVNSLAQVAVSAAGAVRPTTRVPVVWTHQRHRHRYGADLLPGFGGDHGRLDVVTHDDPRFADVTLVDTPDLDSVVVEHRQIAVQVLAAADLCVWVTTAQRYADAVPWEVLQGARERGVPLLVVLNRMPPGAADAVSHDLARRLADASVIDDADDLDVVTIAETPPQAFLDRDRLPRQRISDLERIVLALGDRDRRTRVVLTALRSSLAHATASARRVSADVDAEHADADALSGAAITAYARQRDRLVASLRDGRIIHDEVIDRWQRFVGTGELVQAMTAGAARVRTWARRILGGSEGAATVQREARSQLADTIARHADRAAAQTAEAWELSPAGAVLLEGSRGRLWRADPAVDDQAARLVEEWQDRLASLVEQQGAGRKRVAQVASVGVNGAAATLMLAVFAQTGGLTGAEVGITAGAAALQQKVLEHLFGSAAARKLVIQAREFLESGITAVLVADRARFVDLLTGLTAPRDQPARIRAAVDAAESAAASFLQERADA